MKNQSNRTIIACFTGYIVQAVVNNFAPLLFLTFQRAYGIPLSQITVLVTINFGVQLLADILSAGFADKIGYRASMVIAHAFGAVGLLLLPLLPELLPNPFVGILTAVVFYAIGGGLLEVLVSPVVEACPSDNKEKAMSMLHSFYCWGHVGVVAFSTLFFRIFGIDNWKVMAFIWALVPLYNGMVFIKVPIPSLMEEGEKGLSVKELFSAKIFLALFIMMVCAGASEQSVSQWASTFAEKGLGISKMAGDLAGPMAFAALMGLSRAFYGKYGDKINLNRFMICSSVLCVVSYLCISLVPIPLISLIACAVCGLSVGIMWPGTFSRAAQAIPKGGTAMFALLALGGDLGCSLGPALVGSVSGFFEDNLRPGILAAAIFPVLLLAGILLLGKNISSQNFTKITAAGIVFLAVCTSLFFHSSKESESTAIVSSLYSHTLRTVKEICQETKEEKAVIPKYANEENYKFLPQEHDHIREIQGTGLIPESVNSFWFPMEENEKRIPVSCELNYYCGWFEGTGTLVIRALPEITLDNCYEIILTDLKGEVPFWHDHESITDSDCPYSGDFKIGCYYVTADKIYEFVYGNETLEMLNQWNTFPPDMEYLKKGMKGAHPFSYWRLVCSDTGFEDTFFESHEEEDSYELLWQGKSSDDRYHNLITVEGDERRYSLWPVTYGTQEHTYLTWKKGEGIVKYTSYAGSCRDMISFWEPEYEKQASVEEKQNIDLWMEQWKGEYRFHECAKDSGEASFKFRDYFIRIYREGEEYYGDISICGPDTKVSVKARVYRIQEEYIAFFFLEYLPDHMTGTFSDGDDHALLLLRQMGDEVYTYWEDIMPMLEENERSGIICFHRQ